MNFSGAYIKFLSLVLIVSSFSSICLGASVSEHEEGALKEASRSAYLGHLEAVESREFSNMLEVGVKVGVMEGVQTIVGQSVGAMAAPVLQDLTKPVAACVKYPFSLANKWFHLIVFGSRRLAWNDIATMNNTIFDLIQPMTVQSIGDLTKERRAELVGAQQGDETVVDKGWMIKKRYLLKEIDQVIKVVKNKQACYSTISVGSLRKVMGSFYALFATEQRAEISKSLENAVEYCNEIKKLLEPLNSSKQIDENRETLKFLLGRALRSFKAIANLINEEVACQPAGSHQPGYLKFNELNAQGAGGLGGLDQLFAESNAGTGS